MARLFQSGFELNSLTTGVEFDTISSSLPIIQTSTVRAGSYAMEIKSLASGTAKGVAVQWQASATTSNIYIRFYLNIATLPNHDSVVLGFGTSNPNNTNINVILTTTGALQLFNSSTQIGSNSSLLSTGTWYRVEVHYDDAGSGFTDSAELLLNGVSQASGSSLAIFSSDTVYFGGNLDNRANTATTGDWFIADIAINDTTGSNQTGYPGAGQIVHVQPNGAGDTNTFAVQVGGTAGSANNYTRVDEVTPDDATSYNASVTLNQEDLFTVGSSGVGSSDTVNVVAVGLRFANIIVDNTTAIKAEIEKKSGGTISSSSSIDPDSTNWATNTTTGRVSPAPIMLYQDPDGDNWTNTSLTAMQIGYKLTTAGTNTVAISTVWASIDYTPGTSGFNPDVSDTTTTSENVSLYITALFITVSDTTTTSESVVMDGPALPSVSDTTTTSESVSVELISLISKSDTTTTSETVAQAIVTTLTASDTTTTSENQGLLELFYVTVSDTTTTNESVTVVFPASNTDVITVTDSTSTSENVVVEGPASPNVNDITSTSDNVQLELISNRSVSDTTTTSENVQVVVVPLISASDTVTTTDMVYTSDYALQFNGTSNYVEVATETAFSPATTGSLTVSAWMRPDQIDFFKAFTDSTNGQYVNWLGKSQYGSPNTEEWEFRMYQKDGSTRPNRISFYIFNSAGALGVGSYFQDAVVAGTWINVVGVIDGTNIIIYKNGASRQSNNYAGTITPTATTAPLRWGHVEDGTPNGFFPGAVDDIIIWNRALSASEVTSVYNGSPPASGIVGQWNMDDGSGTTVTDSSGNSYNGTLKPSAPYPVWVPRDINIVGPAIEGIVVSDTTTTSENVSLLIANYNIPTDDITVTFESVVLQIAEALSPSDTTTTSENVNVEIASLVSSADTTTTSESKTVIISNLVIAVSDTTTTNESIQIILPVTGTYTIIVSDLITTSETPIVIEPTLLVTVSDTTVTSENVSFYEGSYLIAIDETITTSESISFIITTNPPALINVSDTAVTSEAVAANYLIPPVPSVYPTPDIPTTLTPQQIQRSLPLGGYEFWIQSGDPVRVTKILTPYPLDASGTIIQFSNELDDFGQARLRVSAYDTVLKQFGDILVPHENWIEITKNGLTVWQGPIIENVKRTKDYIEIIAAEPLWYLNKVMISRSSPDPITGATGIYRIFNKANGATTMSAAVTAIMNETIATFAGNDQGHPLSGLTLGQVINPAYPPNVTNAASSPASLSGPWLFGDGISAPSLQFDFQTVLYLLKSFGAYTYADYYIDNNLVFNFVPFKGNNLTTTLNFTWGATGGTPSNLINYNIPRLGQRMVNHLYGVATDINGTVLHYDKTDPVSINTYGYLEGVAAYSDVKDQATLQARIMAELPLISTPDSAALTITQSEKGYPLGTYTVGDIININVSNKAVSFSDNRRVVGITVQVNGTGRETISIQTNKVLPWQFALAGGTDITAQTT